MIRMFNFETNHLRDSADELRVRMLFKDRLMTKVANLVIKQERELSRIHVENVKRKLDEEIKSWSYKAGFGSNQEEYQKIVEENKDMKEAIEMM